MEMHMRGGRRTQHGSDMVTRERAGMPRRHARLFFWFSSAGFLSVNFFSAGLFSAGLLSARLLTVLVVTSLCLTVALPAAAEDAVELDPIRRAQGELDKAHVDWVDLLAPKGFATAKSAFDSKTATYVARSGLP